MQALDLARKFVSRYTKSTLGSFITRGASVARRFAQTYSVALLARNPANYEPLVKEIEAAGGKAIGISTDCSDSKSVKSAFEQLKKETGGASLAAAIYNVGGRFVRKPFLDLSEEEFEAGWEANGYVEFLPWFAQQ